MTTPDQTTVTPTATGDTAVVPAPVPAATPSDAEIRDLVTQLTQAALLGFDPATVTKGVITASNPTASPPNVSLQIAGDTTTTVDGVTYLDSYSPVVGDTTLIVKQGTSIFVLGQMNDTGSGTANGWQVTGGVSYRKVIDNGDQKVQFKGSFAASGTTLFTLAAGYAPSTTRTLVCGRDGNATSVLLQIDTAGVVSVRNGTVTVGTDGVAPGGTTATATATLTGNSAGSSGPTSGTVSQSLFGSNISDYQICGYLSLAGSDLCHAHNTGITVSGSHSHAVDHFHTVGTYAVAAHLHTLSTTSHSHTQTLVTPATVYFDGLSFFL